MLSGLPLQAIASTLGGPMDDELRTKVEVEAAAKIEWGYSVGRVVEDLVRLGAEQSEAQLLVRKLAARRHRIKVKRAQLGTLVGVALLATGGIAIWLNAHVIRAVWGDHAVIATRSPPQDGVGQTEFVLAYLFGNGGFGLGTCLILVGLGVTGSFLGTLLHERRLTE